MQLESLRHNQIDRQITL